MPHSWPGIWQRNCQDWDWQIWDRLGQICSGRKILQHINISEIFRDIQRLSESSDPSNWDAVPRTSSSSKSLFWLIFWLNHCSSWFFPNARVVENKLQRTNIYWNMHTFSKNQDGLRVPRILKQTLGLDQFDGFGAPVRYRGALCIASRICRLLGFVECELSSIFSTSVSSWHCFVSGCVVLPPFASSLILWNKHIHITSMQDPPTDFFLRLWLQSRVI